jgi:hypothetical protein
MKTMAKNWKREERKKASKHEENGSGGQRCQTIQWATMSTMKTVMGKEERIGKEKKESDGNGQRWYKKRRKKVSMKIATVMEAWPCGKGA